jgi:hypothetical protein
LIAKEKLAVDVESRPVKDALLFAQVIQVGGGDMSLSTSIAAFKGSAVQAEGGGGVGIERLVRITEIAELKLEEVIVHGPESAGILPAGAVGGGIGVLAGGAMVDHGDEDEADLAGVDVFADDLGFGA